MPWTFKYKPKTLSEVVGNEEAKKKLTNWVRSWAKKRPAKRALFIYGPPGVGKTASVEALASDLDMELVQSNASDQRTADAVKRFGGRASMYATLFGKNRLILFDELDGIAGSADRGGLAAITEIVKGTAVPIVLVANSAYDPRFSTLRSHCTLLMFKKLGRLEVTRYLGQLCTREGIEAEAEALKLVAARSGGDVRSAVNDLQALAQGRKQLAYADVAWLADRDRKDVIFNVLRAIFYSHDSLDAKRAVDMADVDPDMLFQWVYENLPHQIKNPQELATTMDALALADIYRRRVRATQNWSLLRYFFDFMSAGVAASWSRRASGWVPFRFPTRLSALSRSRADRAMASAIGMKIKKRCHISSSRAVKEVLPYLRVIFENNAEIAEGIAKWLDLDQEMTTHIKSK